MKNFLDSDVRRAKARRDWLQRAVGLSIRWPKATLATWALVCLAASIGVVRIDVDTVTSSFLDRGNAEWDFYQRSLAQFGGDESILVAVEGDTPFAAAALNTVLELSSQFEDLDGVRRVESITTIPSVLEGPEGSLRIAPAVSGRIDTEESAREIAELVRRDRVASRTLVSKDEVSFAINIRLTADVDADRTSIIDTVEESIAGRRAWHSGVPVFRAEVNRKARDELAMYVPGTLVLVFLVMWAVFRSLLAAFVALASAGIGAWIVVGIMGLTGTSLSLSTMTLPPIVLALGCAYASHVLAAVREKENPEGLEVAICQIARAVGYSGLTTAIGFLAMATVSIQAIRDLGTFGSLGSIVVMGTSLTFVPPVLRLRMVGPRTGRLDNWLSGELLSRLVRWNRKSSRKILLLWLAIAFGLSLGILSLHVDTDIIRWFPRGTDTRESLEAVRSRISGITAVNAIVEGQPGRAVTDPISLRAIHELTNFIESLDEVGTAVSVADVVVQAHAEIGGDSDRKVPESRALIEQYLSILGSADFIRDLISDDREAANIVIRANSNGSSEILELAEKIDDWWRQNGPAHADIGITGIMYEFGRAENAIAYAQMRGLGLALGAVGLILFALLRSVGSALAALIPNLLPIGIVYGLMGLLRIPLDAATVCVGSIALGIAVDDTIHVAMGWRERVMAGASPEEALDETLRRVLFPLVVTTISVAGGFLVLGISEFTLIRHFGVVTGCVVILCLIADLTLLPTLLKWVRLDRQAGS